MSNLKELYITMESLRKLNLPIDDKLKQEAALLEEDLIRKEVLPMLTEQIEPALQQVQRELVLVVDYVPGEDLKVHLSRKRNLANVLADAVEISPKRTNVCTDHENPRSQSVGFTVKFADGYTVAGYNAKQTFIEALRHMSFRRVSEFQGRTFAGFPLVSRRQRVTMDNYKWQEQVDGWWIYTNMSNETKIDMLHQIAKFLHITLTIESNGQVITGDESIQNTGLEKSHKPRAMFSLNGGEPTNKRNSVLAAVRLYMKHNPLATYAQIKRTFPDELQGSYGVIATTAEIQQRIHLGQDTKNRYFLAEEDILTSADGVRFAVCHEWGHQFANFQKHISTLGWTLEEV
jgi:hypothetical protein